MYVISCCMFFQIIFELLTLSGLTPSCWCAETERWRRWTCPSWVCFLLFSWWQRHLNLAHLCHPLFLHSSGLLIITMGTPYDIFCVLNCCKWMIYILKLIFRYNWSGSTSSLLDQLSLTFRCPHKFLFGHVIYYASLF